MKPRKDPIVIPAKNTPPTSGSGEMNPEYNYLFKFKLLGDSGVGKSCLLLRFADDRYTDSFISTIGVNYKIRALTINDKVVKLQIWDTAGLERFRTIESQGARGAHAFIVVFDLTDQVSFNHVPNWIRTIVETAVGDKDIILVGAKSDLTTKRVVDRETVLEYIRTSEYPIGGYVEVSSKIPENVDAVFETAAALVIDRVTPRVSAATVSAATAAAATPTPAPSMWWGRVTSLFSRAPVISSPVPRSAPPVPYKREEESVERFISQLSQSSAAAAAAPMSHSRLYPSAPSSAAAASAASSSDLNPYSEHLRTYIMSFEGKQTIKARIKELHLTEEEEKRFEIFIDPVSFEYMRIPVKLHEIDFDLETLQKLTENPFTRMPFQRIEIQADRTLMNLLDRIIAEIQSERAMRPTR